MASLDSLTIRKLAIAKQLLSRASLAGTEPGPIASGLGISLSQDALELILRAAIEHRGIKPVGASFEDLIKALEKDGCQVPHRQRLSNINVARVAFKHFGNLPDEAQAKSTIGFAGSAAEQLCQACLNVSLWEVTSLDLIPRTRIRNHLNGASTLRGRGEFESSCVKSAIAFALAFGDIEGQHWDHQRGQPGEHTSSAGRGSEIVGSGRDMSREIVQRITGAVVRDFKTVAEDLDYLFHQLELLKRGIDLDALYRFERLIPTVRVHANTGAVFVTKYHQRRVSEDDATFALEFVTDAIVRARLSPPETPLISGKVKVKTESNLLVEPPNDQHNGEPIVIAEVGDIYDRPKHPHDRGGYLQVFFEGEFAYISAEAVDPVG